MKKIILIFSLVALISLAGCEVDNDKGSVSETETSVSETHYVNDESDTAADKSVKSENLQNNYYNKPGFQKISYNINDSRKPEVTDTEIRAVCTGNIKNQISFENLYNINVLHSGVVGLVGVPLEISYNTENIKAPFLTFYYDKNELRGIPEDNLIVLHYNEETGSYDEIDGRRLNTDNSSVIVQIHEPGVYMLADIYCWYECWGIDASDYAYETDKSEYISDWERECDTGDIINTADKEWAVQNAPEFHVSTPQQLAGAVYYVNALKTNGSEVSIYLENDIDLSGLDWKPMGWDKSYFSGTVDGQGHTISNMKIADEYRTAFIGYGLGTEVYDINFENADISGDSYTGIVGGEIYSSRNWHDIHVSGNVTASGADDYGTIIGREADISFKDCTYDNVLVNGEKFDYPSYRYKRIDDTEIIEAFTLSFDNDGNIVRTESDGYTNLGWYILRDGEVMLHRNAENELVLDKSYFCGNEIYLVAYINGAYVRVSNIITF